MNPPPQTLQTLILELLNPKWLLHLFAPLGVLRALGEGSKGRLGIRIHRFQGRFRFALRRSYVGFRVLG